MVHSRNGAGDTFCISCYPGMWFDRAVSTTRLQRGLRVTFLGMIANVLLAGAKMFTGLVGHSHALVADGVESLADLFSSVIVWRGLVVAAAPADEDHPDRKSTRLNSSHDQISDAVFCLKKKKEHSPEAGGRIRRLRA